MSPVSALLIALALPAMAQDSTTNPLDLFISIVQSVGSELAPTTSSNPSTFATSTSQPASTSVAAVSATSNTPTPTATDVSTAKDTSGLSTGTRNTIIIVCSIVGVLILLLIALGICLCVRRRRRKNKGRGLREEGTKEARTPLRENDWYHGNDSHHGFVGTPAPRSQHEMAQRNSHDKAPRNSISHIADEEPEPPSLADHPAFSRTSDPYTAAGVGAVGAASAARAASSERSRHSLGERRYSDHMPTRKPVGSPPSIRSTKRTSNPLRVDTSSAVAGAAAGAGALASYEKLPSQQNPRHRYSSASSQPVDPFVSPTGQHPEPTSTSPLSSHPSNTFLLYEPVPERPNSRFSFEEGTDRLLHDEPTPTQAKAKAKRPPTPLGFDFGIPSTSNAPEHQTAVDPESMPLTSDFEEKPLTAPAFASRYDANNPHHGGIGPPTAAQRRSLEGRSQHYLEYQATESVPALPERSPRRLSRASFDEPAYPGAGLDEFAIPPRSPKRASFSRSRENVSTPKDIFRDSGDFVYPSPRSAYSISPRHSPNTAPALGFRSRDAQQDARSHAQGGQSYSEGRSRAFEQHHDHPVYGPGDSGAASSVESWVSARAVPTPWEDNAIRRNSSSGHLRRPSLGQEQSSSSNGKSAKRTSAPVQSRHHGSSGSPATVDRYDDPSYQGPGTYDPTWGEGHAEEPVFEKYGAQRSRRRSSSSGFDPRYGRWTNSTFDDEFGHDDGYGVGKAL